MNGRQTEAITDWLCKRVRQGFCDGPFDLDTKFDFPLHTIPLFPVNKPELHKYRTIAHGSYRRGDRLSINDHISEEYIRIRYITLKEIVSMLVAAGPHAWMWARDIEDAFYNVPLAKSEFCLMGMKWCGKLWIFNVFTHGYR